MNHTKNISPWAWVPTLYFAQGIPYFIVNNISVMMFTKMGVPNGEMALFTSLLYLPWTIKPFWSPFVDIIKTKRWWTLSMQILMSVAFILLTLSIPRPDEATMAAGTTPHQHVQHHADAVHHHGFCLCHTRHCRRRLLHAGTETE